MFSVIKILEETNTPAIRQFFLALGSDSAASVGCVQICTKRQSDKTSKMGEKLPFLE